MTREGFFALAEKAAEKVNLEQARREVEPFVKDPDALAVWSNEFFREVMRRIVLI